jgi:HD domain
VCGGSRQIALSGLIGALSYALDITEGEPPGHATRSCLIGMRLADELGLGAVARSDLFYALLLKDAGCSANSARIAALFAADDQVAKRTSKRVDWARPFSAFVWSLRTVAPGGSLRARAERLRAIRDEGEVTRSLMRARCDRGAEIARMLGFSEATAEAIRALDEHWDGRGQPHGLRGTEIPLAGRVLCLAQTVEIFHMARGVGAAYRVAARRRGHWFDEREFLRYRKITADGRQLDVDPRDLYDMLELDKRADRILPNGYCRLPPRQSCDRGNACLTCDKFATDRTHLDEHQRQLSGLLQIVDARREQFQRKTGREMPELNVWLRERRKERRALQSIIAALDATAQTDQAVRGAGVQARLEEGRA